MRKRGPWWDASEGVNYERGRPDYPAAAIELVADYLGWKDSSRVADVAAGTGKLTRRLVESEASVVAVEPMPGMREEFRLHLPDTPVVAASAERLPLADKSLDAITVAQAFHWFNVVAASAEFHRALAPGGHLVLFTNKRHAPEPWQRDLWSILRRYEELGTRPPSTPNWREILVRAGDFGTFERFEVPNVQRFATVEEFDARFTSVSFVIMLAAEQRKTLLEELHQAIRGVDELVVPMRTEIEVATRRG